MSESTWTRRRADKRERLSAVAGYVDGKVIEQARLRDTLEALLRPGDRVALEGDNQKQADFLSRTLAAVRPGKVHGLHMLISSVSRPEHLDLFERGIASKLDLAYAGPQSVRIAQLVEDGTVTIGAIHTYVELYARMFIDLRARRRAAVRVGGRPRRQPLHRSQHRGHADHRRGRRVPRRGGARAGRRDRRAAASCPRVDIPGDWVDLVVEADRPFALEPLFTRDPRLIGPVEILKAMIAIRGVYERHEVTSLNHGIGFDTAAIELILPTYGEQLGLKGRIAKHWTLNPHPTLIPAIESGWVESIHSFGGEAGMERYTAARPDVFFTGGTGRCGPTGCCASSPASTRSTCSSARRCRSTATRTRRPSPTAGCRDSAAPRTWATTRTAAGTRRPPG